MKKNKNQINLIIHQYLLIIGINIFKDLLINPALGSCRKQMMIKKMVGGIMGEKDIQE